MPAKKFLCKTKNTSVYILKTTQGDTNMTLYTAIGKYEFRKDTDGNKMPVIIAEEKEYTLDTYHYHRYRNIALSRSDYDFVRATYVAV